MNMFNQFSRFQQILLVLLVIQIALGAAVFLPRTVDSQAAGPLLADFAPDQVSSLTISDDASQTITLAKEGQEWLLPEADGYPVQGDNVTTLLDKLAEIQTNRLVTETSDSHARLGVGADNPSRQLQITLSDGTQQTLLVGSSAGAGATHIRTADQPQVYLTDALTQWDANTAATSWVDTLYFTLPQTATTRLLLENPNGSFEFVQTDGSWSLADLAPDETLNEAAVTTLVNQASSIRLTEPVGREAQTEFGLEQPQATLTLETGSETYTLQVGAQDPSDSSYIFKASNSPYYVRIAQFSGDNFVTKSRTDFLQAPPEAEPEAAEPADAVPSQ